ncbi:MAG: protein-L-isoaspartate(D-aspartate) O-methyltransferase [Rhodospirillaceae bacterium]|nr:protein-L-isoaspartate(D-aspartate) O-methyltransferase [Rhodospirillaceae bacterium]
MRFLFTLRSRGVTDARTLNAMEKVDRGAFVTGLFADRAYEDMPLPISCGQTISQPSVVGLMTQALNVQPRDKVLEVGTGSGYQAAILAGLSRRVYTIERHEELLRKAQVCFDKQRLHNITTMLGDGSKGWPRQAPFDRIMVTAAAPSMPEGLIEQLAPGGIMIVPVGEGTWDQKLYRVQRLDEGYESEAFLDVRFVPLVSDGTHG